MLFVSALFTLCDSVGSPSGGPSDTLPPAIVVMEPDNFSTNMDTLTRRIYIEFDEFVNLVDQQKHFFTSPQMKNKPQLQMRGRGIVITLRDTLKKNTTYALNFGGAIQDNNEGNPLYSMRYVFSTGEKIDSLIMSGYTEDSFKADSVSNSFVLFYPKDSIEYTPEYDSTLFNATPAVIARAETNGIFMAQNLKPIPYYIYALDDTNGNMTYEPGVDKVGFVSGTYNPAEMNEFSVWYDSVRRYVVAEPQLHFRLFLDQAFQRHILLESERPTQRKAILKFGANYPIIDSIVFDSIPADRFQIEYLTKGRDTLALWFDMDAENLPDTIKGRVTYFKHDSLRQLVSTTEELKLSWKYFETKAEEKEREKLDRERKKAEESGEEWVEPEVPNPFKVTVSNEQINPERSVTFDFDFPLRSLDSAAITFTRLTVEEQEFLEKYRQAEVEAAAVAALNQGAVSEPTEPVKEYQGEAVPYTLHQDSLNIRRYHLKTNWGDMGDKFYFTLPKGAVQDIAGFTNDSIVKVFSQIDKAKYATLVVDIAAGADPTSRYVLELMDGAETKVLERKTGVGASKTTFNYVPAGGVTLRVVEDLNKNGEWDSGNLIERRQSEKSKMYSVAGDRVVLVKENWEVEIAIDPVALFADETQADLAARLEREEQERIELAKKKNLEKK